MIKRGKLIIISAPSGSGKTTVVHHLLDQDLKLEFSISACSRKKRHGETDGKDYYFFSTDTFRKKIKNDEFIEWEEVYEGQYYGTLRSEVERIWNNGNHPIFDIDVKGGLNMKKRYKKDALAVFIMPPSVDELEKRLIKRSTDQPGNIEKRTKKALEEIEYASQFDIVIINDKLDVALNETTAIVRNFLNQ